ncbi:a5768f5c-59ae-401c-a374-e3a71f7e4cb1 [Sclerotinia trifoliorum]|uniref:Serine/threonine-protein kinase RIO2 n=1 Tax=Sclerotinia trifoliorum TaxID=28548 RepID=A0A8H2W2L5_9HELO|nr:a5768f5c-59ae-401c-a374-e3a71f7e4cb1 [Sclerotinia trifoliorum]
MKLDTKAMRYLTAEDWRTLTAVEQGSKNHEVVPTKLIEQLSGLRGGVHRCISALAKVNLIARLKNAKYDGYRLTYGGLDYLALNTYRKRKDVYSVGNQIGVGKESDIFVVADEKGVQRVLKIHRLGRISFRTVKANRDYLRHRSSASWMHMSRLAALKEFTFMTALRDNGFPVPEPLAQSRHTIVMSLIDAFPMRQISSVPDPASLYAELISMILRLAQYGLIHGDFNEFNILIKEEANPEKPEEPVTLTPILIDFPQMVSVDHVNAEYYFDRDVNCIKRFFDRRFHFTSNEKGPHFKDARKLIGKDGVKRLDVSVEASGFSKKMAKELEAYMKAVGVDGDGDGKPGAERSDDEFDDEEEASDDDDDDEEEEEDGDAAIHEGDSHVDPAKTELQGEKTTEIETEGSAGLLDDRKAELSLSNLKIEEKT